MNATRAATIRGRAWVGGVVSLGRVQTPTLALLVKREREIQAFVPGALLARPRAVRSSLRGPLVRGRRDARSRRRSAREEIADEGLRQGRRRRVGRAQGAVRARAAALRPDLAAARREPPLRLLGAPHPAGRAVALRGQEGDHLSAHQLTLALRRPRPAAEADRRHAPADRRVRRGRALRGRPAAAAARRESSTTRRSPTTTRSSRPTSSTTSAAFSPDERRIFDLVARRFLAVFHPPARYARTTVVTPRRGGALPLARQDHARGRAGAASTAALRGRPGRAEAGRGRRERERRSCRRSSRGRWSTAPCAEVEAKETKPPPRYTEATLLSAMETAGKLIDDEELREAMKESGLGTPRHARRDDRDADPPRVHRARRQRPRCRPRRACR